MAEVGRKCPFCAEEIKAEAIKCKHCGSEVAPLPRDQKKRAAREAAKANYVPYPVVFLVFIAIGFWIYFQASDGSSSAPATPVPSTPPVVTEPPPKPVVPPEPVEITHWGDYKSADKWKVFIIPENVSRTELVTAAREVFKKYPDTKSRFFDDAEKIQQYIDAEKFLWDTTGSVARAEFPTEWRKQHLIGIISDRSTAGYGRWQVVYNKGGVSEHLVFLE